MLTSSVMEARHGAVLASFVLASALPLAFAIPADPTWFGGLYDGADSHAVVLSAPYAKAIREPDLRFGRGSLEVLRDEARP